MRVEQQPAFVLHGRAYRETSLLLECLTRDHGRVGLVARGVRTQRSRLPRALLQPLIPLSLSWTGAGELATLTAAEGIDAPPVLSGEALLCGLYLTELVLRLTMRQDPHGDVFDSYALTLQRLARGESPAWTLRRFERDLLEQLGYGLNLGTDAASGAALDPFGQYGYRHESGPTLWRTSADGPKVSGAALLALAADTRPADADLVALRRWMRGIISGLLDGRELESWKLLASPAPRSSD
jgi:DNA repair protein RecO (recombination protein O)